MKTHWSVQSSNGDDDDDNGDDDDDGDDGDDGFSGYSNNESKNIRIKNIRTCETCNGWLVGWLANECKYYTRIYCSTLSTVQHSTYFQKDHNSIK